MAKIVLTTALRADYQRLFDQCKINPAKASAVEQTIQKIQHNNPAMKPSVRSAARLGM